VWLALLLVAGPGLWIGTATDCPSAAQVREQIAPLLPAGMTVVDTGDAPAPADADRGDVLVQGGERRVRLRGPDERYNHERVLPAALSCAEAARTAAVLLAAWEFQGRADARGEAPALAPPAPETVPIEIDRSPPPPAPTTPLPTQPTAPAKPPTPTSTSDPPKGRPPVAPAATLTRAPIPRRFALGGGVWAGARSDRLVASAAAEATYGPARGIGWRLQLATTTRDSLPVGVGQAVWTRSSVALSLTETARLGHFGLEVRTELLGARYSIEGQDLVPNEKGTQLALGLGAGARTLLALGSKGDLWLDVTVIGWPGRHQLLLRGASQSAELPRVEVGVGIGVDFFIWP
jgi:hypothetical protein